MPTGIRKRGANSWQLTVSDGYDEHGKKRVFSKTVRFDAKKTERAQLREAEAAYAEFRTEVKRGLATTGKQITFAEFVTLWMKEHVEATLAPKTAYEYQKQLNRVLPTLGHIKMQQISPLHINRLYKSLGEAGLSPNSVHAYHRMLSALLGKAYKWGYITMNPLDRVDAPKKTRKEAPRFNLDLAQRLLSALDDEPLKYRCFISLAIFTGLRSSELVGLRWYDIDFENGELHVQQIVQFIAKGQMVTKTPKRDSTRTVSFPPQVGVLLQEVRSAQAVEAQQEDWQDQGFVFTQQDGRVMFPTTPSQWFLKFLKRRELAPMRLHDLRHLHASLMIAEGVDPVTVSKRLGHANTSTTLNLYAHALREKDKAASDRLAASLFTK